MMARTRVAISRLCVGIPYTSVIPVAWLKVNQLI